MNHLRLHARLLFIRLRPWLPFISLAVAFAAVMIARHFQVVSP
jgi:hypothetical protein